MKRLRATFAMSVVLGLSATASAQTRGFAAGAFVLDDLQATNHKVVIKAPVFGSAAWTAWQAAPYNGQTLNWSIPIPPSDNAQAGFMPAGPMTTPPPGTKPMVPYWIYPQQSDATNGTTVNGGPMGTWNFARTDQLGIMTTNGTGTQNYVTKWSDGTGTQLGNSAISEDGTTFNINTTSGGATSKFAVTLATGNVDAEGSGTFGTGNMLVLANGTNEMQAADGTINTPSGINVNGGKFTVDQTTGNTVTQGALSVGTIASGGVSVYALPNNASYVQVADDGTGTGVSLTAPATPQAGKILYIHNADAQATTGFAVIPSGDTWAFVYDGTTWQLLP